MTAQETLEIYNWLQVADATIKEIVQTTDATLFEEAQKQDEEFRLQLHEFMERLKHLTKIYEDELERMSKPENHDELRAFLALKDQK